VAAVTVQETVTAGQAKTALVVVVAELETVWPAHIQTLGAAEAVTELLSCVGYHNKNGK
jgi:hypothetical protein